jgi:type II secretory pathway pseudopilin PulG
MIRRTIKRLRRQDGISLIETVLMIIILAIALPAITRLLQQNVIASARMTALNKATFYAQQRIEEIIAEYANTSDSDDVHAAFESMSDYHFDPVTSETGYTTDVRVQNDAQDGVSIKVITVTCTNPMGPEVALQTWIADI